MMNFSGACSNTCCTQPVNRVLVRNNRDGLNHIGKPRQDVGIEPAIAAKSGNHHKILHAPSLSADRTRQTKMKSSAAPNKKGAGFLPRLSNSINLSLRSVGFLCWCRFSLLL